MREREDMYIVTIHAFLTWDFKSGKTCVCLGFVIYILNVLIVHTLKFIKLLYRNILEGRNEDLRDK